MAVYAGHFSPLLIESGHSPAYAGGLIPQRHAAVGWPRSLSKTRMPEATHRRFRANTAVASAVIPNRAPQMARQGILDSPCSGRMRFLWLLPSCVDPFGGALLGMASCPTGSDRTCRIESIRGGDSARTALAGRRRGFCRHVHCRRPAALSRWRADRQTPGRTAPKVSPTLREAPFRVVGGFGSE